MAQRNWATDRQGLVFLTVLLTRIILTAGCGKYIAIKSSSDTGSLSSPNYPSAYSNSALCIWFLRAPVDYAVVLTIPSMSGQENSGVCMDYLEVRNGSATASLEYKECDTSTSATVQSTSRWLWVKFKSDDTVTNTGFTASYSVTSSPGNADDETTAPDCRSVSYRCPNKECISWAYVCDGSEDCGCSHSGCDEIGCGGIHWSLTTKMIVGFTTGFVLFCVIFFGLGILDVCLKRHSLRKYQRETEERKKLAKQKRARAAVQNLFVETKLDIPGSGSISRQSSWCRSAGDKTPTTPTSLAAPSSPRSLKGK